MVGLFEFLVFASVLIGIGLYGILSRKNLLTLIFASELLFSGINLTFAALAKFTQAQAGITFVFFIMAAIACETVLILALVIVYYRREKTTNIDHLSALKG